MFNNKTTSIFFLSGMYGQEAFMPSGAKKSELCQTDGTECYCDSAAGRILRKEVAKHELEAIHWIDGGDYHYMSLFFLERITEPFALLYFDNHSDDQACAFSDDLLSCGSWVLRARESLPLMKADIWVGSGTSRLNSAFHANAPVSISSSSPEELLGLIPPDLPLYISIDLDVLSVQWAATNWDQGEMTLPELKKAINLSARDRRIIGVDICGGLSEEKGAMTCQLALNCNTHSELQEYFLNLKAN